MRASALFLSFIIIVLKKRLATLAATAAILTIPLSKMIKHGPAPQGVIDPSASQIEMTDMIKCPSCSPTEQKTLVFFQELGIEDKNSLAVILGNIKQESKFNALVCEGGKSTGYHGCKRGGFGLLQWTTPSRYYGLGRHAKAKGLSPNSIDAQLSWMIHEVEWKKIEAVLKRPGQSIQQYMNVAWRWIGWGVHGARTTYAYQYLNQFQ